MNELIKELAEQTSSILDYRVGRPVTCEMIERAESGEISWKDIAIDMMNWVTDNQVHQMAEHNGYIVYEDE